MNMTKLLALVLSLVMVLGLLAGCQPSDQGTTQPVAKTEKPIDLADVVEHKDYTTLYEMIGSKVTIDMVTEDEETGLATVTYEGKTYDLGMDFLSYAMVYNTAVPEGSKYTTSQEIYDQWWKLYIQRWNYLVPEVPLYSNRIFNLYNSKIEDLELYPLWAPADAIISAKVNTPDNSAILGATTELSGAFRNPSWGKSSPGASDNDIYSMTTGYATMMTDKNGNYQWNMDALAEVPTRVINEDGSLTFTIKIKSGLVFSDGSAINAKNYIAGVLANSNEVLTAIKGKGTSGQMLVGFDTFSAYNGTNESETATKYFSGVKLLDDYTFSITYLPEYATYHYVDTYAAFSPDPLALYLGENDIIVAEDKSCGLSEGFYAKTTKDGAEVYAMGDIVLANLKWNSKLPYSGPYTVKNFDEATLTATLELNPKYPGDTIRGKASIKTITYVKTVTETVLDQFKTGQVDIVTDLMDASEIKGALALLEEGKGAYKKIDYDRAAYGKLGFRADVGPASFLEVRQAIMYTINRNEFAQTFTGGYGSVVHGAYYEGFTSFQNVKNDINLNPYTYSVDDAIAVLEEGGWIYNSKGEAFDASKDDVRYKKLSGYELSKFNLQYASTDNKYKTINLDGEYYMPLAFNWYGTQPNPVTDLLITSWQETENATKKIGMYITYTSCDFTTGLYGEYLHLEAYGWDGVAKLTGINFASSFTSALYDYSWNWSIEPTLFENYSAYYLRDEADFWENYQ